MRSSVYTKNPGQLSEELRRSAGPHMRARRQVVGLSLVSSACMGVVAAYQIGAIGRIPEPPLPMLDADAVDAAPEAYRLLTTGDAFLGFVSYGVTMLLAGMGGARRHEQQPWLAIALAAKAAFDAAQAARLTHAQWTKHRGFCSWCLAAAASTFAALPLAVPEARSALATLRRRA